MNKNGVVLFEGPSALNGSPIVAILTALNRPSKNKKTGPIAQVFILNGRHNPLKSAWQGADASVCGDCKLRPILTMNKRGRIIKRQQGACYVNVARSPLAVYRSWKAGSYSPLGVAQEAKVARKVVRWGAYGDPTALPRNLIERISQLAAGHRAYTHQWAKLRFAWLRFWAMASVDSELEKQRANAAGWRTFRVKRADEKRLADEMVCPASEEGGHRATCNTCRACSGASFAGKNVVINVHGEPHKKTAFALLTVGLEKIQRK